MNPKEISDANLKLAQEILDGKNLSLGDAVEALHRLSREVIYRDALVTNMEAEVQILEEKAAKVVPFVKR